MEHDYETKFYVSIFEEVSHNNENGEILLLMVCKKLIELMSFLEESEDKEFVKNALIVIIALLKDYIPDFPMKKGTDLEFIPKQEREALENILREEFTV